MKPSLHVKRLRFEAQRGLCLVCTNPMPEPGAITGLDTDQTASWEHVIPLALGGTDHVGNLGLSHRSCNNKRGARAPSRRMLKRHAAAIGQKKLHAMLENYTTRMSALVEPLQQTYTLAKTLMDELR